MFKQQTWPFLCHLEVFVRILFVLLLAANAGSAQDQFGSQFRSRYAGEKNGPYGECRTDWTPLGPGLDYRAITCLGESQTGDLDLHVIRVDPSLWQLNAYLARDASARAVVRDKHAVFAINANFFDSQRNPLGLVVRSGEQVRHPREISWQAVFLVHKDGTARIVHESEWTKQKDEAFMAVQAGPRLVIAGHTVRVRQSYAAERAGVCIQKPNQLLFFATPSDRKFDMYEIARIARRDEVDGGLACQDAMLFDGGHSTQIYLKTERKKVSMRGDPAPVFVYVKPRETKETSRGIPAGAAN